MTDHIAVLVFGPQSAGNHMMFEILRRLGCKASLGGADQQPFDLSLPPPSRTIVWGKSLPSNGAWPDVRGMIGTAAAAGYVVRVIAITRGMFPLVRSVLARGRCDDEATARAEIRTAMHLLHNDFDMVVRHDSVVNAGMILISYEELVARPVEVTKWLADELGLKWSPTVASAIRDENAKHWAAR